MFQSATLARQPTLLEQGKDDNEWNVVGGTPKVQEMAVSVLKKIRWRQPGQDGDPKTDIDVVPADQPQAADDASQNVPAIQSEEVPTIDPFSERSPESAERRKLIAEAKERNATLLSDRTRNRSGRRYSKRDQSVRGGNI